MLCYTTGIHAGQPIQMVEPHLVLVSCHVGRLGLSAHVACFVMSVLCTACSHMYWDFMPVAM